MLYLDTVLSFQGCDCNSQHTIKSREKGGSGRMFCLSGFEASLAGLSNGIQTFVKYFLWMVGLFFSCSEKFP